jgi:hypothetical protein
MRNTERENPDIGKDVKIGREKKERLRMVAMKGDTNRDTKKKDKRKQRNHGKRSKEREKEERDENRDKWKLRE